MYKKLLTTALISSALAVASTSVANAQAAGYPDRSVKLMVAAAAGSSPDSISRLLATKLGERWGQTVVVENAVGLGGVIGAEKAAREPADGYHLVVNTIGAMSVGASIMKNFPYDPVKDFEPISLLMSMPNLLVVNPNVPVKTLPELVAYVKENPGKLRYGHPGIGTTPHLSAELLKQMTGIQMQGIPYKSSAQMTTDLLAGHYEVLFHNSSVLMPHVKAGKAVPLGITSAKRMATMPDVPTIDEAGKVDGFEVRAWWGMYAPAGTPKDIVNKISKDVDSILAEADVQEWLKQRNGIAGGGTPESLRDFQAAETTKWRKLIETAGIKAE